MDNKAHMLTVSVPTRSMNQVLTHPLVMLVDDNDTDNLITRRVLELSGFTERVVVQSSGKSALEYLEQHRENAGMLPDLLFLDINMPIVDGFVFLYELEKFADTLVKPVQVVILSSSDSSQDIDRIIDNPRVVGFVTKPLSPAILRDLKAA